MHTLNRERELLVPVPETNSKLPEIPAEIASAIETVDFSSCGVSQLERFEAQVTFIVWTSTLLEMQRLIVNRLTAVTQQEKEDFSKAFESALAEFVKHPDHGMLHSFFVYKGMQHLYSRETGKTADEATDIEMQLLAVLHDAFQTLPYKVAGEDCGIVSKVQKNDHAKIVAKLIKLFGPQFGISRKKAGSIAFDLEVHDSSYDKELHPDKISFLGSLLHDSDKLFGTSTSMHPQELARGLFRRNAIANNTNTGAYIMRSELSPDYRKKITYGDRCYSDGFSLALSEINLPMYTQSAQDTRDERKEFALQELLSVYSQLFEDTATNIEQFILPNLDSRSLQLFAVALGNPSKRLSHIDTLGQLRATVDEMYTTVLQLPEEYHRNSYVTPSDSRGWKIEAVLNGQEIIIDPSIARFYFRPNGKEAFLKTVKKAFVDVALTA